MRLCIRPIQHMDLLLRFLLVGEGRLELPTRGFSGHCYYQLSYPPVRKGTRRKRKDCRIWTYYILFNRQMLYQWAKYFLKRKNCCMRLWMKHRKTNTQKLKECGCGRRIRTLSPGYEPSILPLEDLRNGTWSWSQTNDLPGMNRPLLSSELFRQINHKTVCLFSSIKINNIIAESALN